MGEPKALLPIDGTTFLGKILDNHRALGAGRVVLVLGRDAGAVLSTIPTDGLEVAINPHPGQGQLSSLLAGLDAVRPLNPEGVIVHPVDHPMVRFNTLRLIASAGRLYARSIVIPTCRGRRGHPVFFPAALFGELAKAPLSAGARAVTRSGRAQVVEVRTDDEGILRNIDTQDAYEGLRRDLQRTA